jgi:hypothetical protein
LLALIHDLYEANKENQTFLHTRSRWFGRVRAGAGRFQQPSPDLRKHFRRRLEKVSPICSDFGYGADEYMESLLQRYED